MLPPMICKAARCSVALAGALLAVFAWVQSARCEEASYTLRVQHYFLPTSAEHKDWLVPWARLLEQDSKGRLKVEIYPAMQLGGRPTELYEQARTGTVDIVWTITGYTPDRFPRFEVFELPWVAPSEAIRASATAWDYYERYAKNEFADVKLLAISTSGRATLFLHNRAARRPSDLANLPIRVSTRIVGKSVQAYGAVPKNVAVTQLGPAFSKGEIAGLVTQYRMTRTLELDQHINHVTEFTADETLYTAVYIIVMNKARFESLPLDLQNIIEGRTGHRLSAQLGWQLDLWEHEAERAVKDGPAEVVKVEGAALAPWKAAAQEQIADWVAARNAAGDDGSMLLEGVRRIAEQYR
jgi:TRAP-type C4-dicarboxylate transport system substrate-binding protein